MRVCTRCGTPRPSPQFYDKGSWCRPCTRTYSLDYRRRFPLRRKAATRVAAALKYGELVRPNVCERCGAKKYTVAHHENYRRALAVNWLCDSCHALRHFELGRHAPKRRASKANGKKGGRPKGS